MKKALLVIIAILCVAGQVMAAADTYTTYYNLTKPGRGSASWDTKINTNFDTIDSRLYSTLAAINIASGLTPYYVSSTSSITDHSDNTTDGSLANVIDDIGSLVASLVMVGSHTYPITSDNVTIPSNVRYEPQNGAILSIASGKSVTFDSPDQIRAGHQQLFAGSGQVRFTKPGTVFPEWWPVDDDNTSASANAAFTSALASMPDDGGGRIWPACRDWHINLEVNKPNMALELCGSQHNSWWTAPAFKPYDISKPAIKVLPITVSGVSRPNTGFQLRNARIAGNGSTSLYGWQIQSCEYCSGSNFKIQNLLGYGLKIGDSGNSAGQYNMANQFVDFEVTADDNASGQSDAIVFERGSSWITSQNFVNGHINGPAGASNTGYAIRDGYDATYTNVYVQAQTGNGLYHSASSTSPYWFANSVIEGDLSSTVVVLATVSNSAYNVLKTVNTAITGMLQTANGVLHDLNEHNQAYTYKPIMYDIYMGGRLYLTYGIDSNETQQVALAHRVSIHRDSSDDLNIYAAGGTTIQSPVIWPGATLYTYNTGGGYSIHGYSLEGVAALMESYTADNGTDSPIYPVWRTQRTTFGATVAGFGSSYEAYLQNGGAGSALAGTWRFEWTDPTHDAEDSKYVVRVKKDAANVDAFAVNPIGIEVIDHTPATVSEACTKGTITWDNATLYVCTTTDHWKKAALSPF